ncbi:pentapeptide repeat-containing protein [Desulfovibrio cuneatus]|uniref:pentapeptide repeat-containing protein n=1 Tax=Desulfovibrio cuneatus TaxID=159728 RepID=UPI0003F51BC6|nr:pentapeptide repeat-containing protein [Desulfovibrio cuneatus]
MNDGLWLLNWEKCLYPEGYQCDIAQYRLLKECSESKCITKWNEWRERNPNTEIWLQGANLSQWDLQDADFSNANCERAHFWKAHCERALFQDANCAGASFQQAYCEKAEFNLAHCEKTRFWKADCNNACFCNAYCDQADFTLTHCQKAEFDFADCGNSVFASANCEGANFSNASCEGALFVYANCEGAIFDRANLNNACFSNVIVSSRSSFLECKMNRNTLLTNSSLSSIMTESGTRALLERNIRQAEWEKWYVDHPIQKWPVRFFWLISDYGYSTGNVILCFFATWVIFSSRVQLQSATPAV